MALCRHIISVCVARGVELADLSVWPDRIAAAATTDAPPCIAACMRGNLSCADAHAAAALWKVTRLQSCVEEPGDVEFGHEGVCAFRFLVDYLVDSTWSHVYFAHGDITRSKHRRSYNALQALVARSQWPEWPEETRRVDGSVLAANFNQATFGPVDFWHPAINWWLSTFIQYRGDMAMAAASWERAAPPRHVSWPLHNGTLRFPISFLFQVDRVTALRRSTRFYRAQYLLCKRGVRVLPASAGGRLRPHQGTPGRENAFTFTPLAWGHVNERLPLFLFGRDFVERPFADCLLDETVRHFNMNCSSAAPLMAREQQKASRSMPPLWTPEPTACPPMDDRCGQTGR